MDNLIAFTVLAGLLTIAPGPDSFLVLRSSLASGAIAGIATTFGVVTGLIAWALASAAGIAAIVVASQEVFRLMQIAGALYLLWLGFQSLRSGLRTRKRTVTVSAPERSALVSYRTGLLSNLLNPKVGVFYLAVFPPFLPDGGSAIAWALGLAVIHVVEGVLWLGAIVVTAGAARRWLVAPRVTATLEGLTGVALIGFGASLLGLRRRIA